MPVRKRARMSSRKKMIFRIGVISIFVAGLVGTAFAFNQARASMSITDAFYHIAPILFATTLPVAFYATFGNPVHQVATIGFYCMTGALLSDDTDTLKAYFILAFGYSLFVLARERAMVARRSTQQAPPQLSGSDDPHGTPMMEQDDISAARPERIFYVPAGICIAVGLYLSNAAYLSSDGISIGVLFTFFATVIFAPALFVLRARGVDVRRKMPRLSQSVDHGLEAAETYEALHTEKQQSAETHQPNETHANNPSTIQTEKSS